ncbi:MAG: MBL fold metallo-hydrolase [Gammaproteobacteria bacterium]|nr:MBL fold metallo-hydrolase [Gammaproteobacteria bacterium]
MKRIPRIAPALLFLVLFVGQSAPADVRRTSNPADRGLTEADFPRVKMLAENVYTYEALTGPDDDRYTTNTLFVTTAEGVLVADGQGSPKETAALVDAIAEITPAPITHVVICSDHGDHTNGNTAFPETADFIAHRNSLPALERAAESGGVMPDTIVDDRLDIKLGGRNIEILFLGRAHTGSDLFVHLPDEKILFATEVFLNHMFSGFRSAYTLEWIDAIERAEALQPELYIPGHGFVDNRQVLNEEWVSHREHVKFVFNAVAELYEAGLTVDEAIERADWGRYSDWSGAEFQGQIAIRRIFAELNGELQ